MTRIEHLSGKIYDLKLAAGPRGVEHNRHELTALVQETLGLLLELIGVLKDKENSGVTHG